MGCDIHAHVEVKIGGEWLHYSAPSIDRDYQLFSRMAGVRRQEDCEPIAEPRGLPVDANKMTRFMSEADGEDGHSHSFLLWDEIKALVKWEGERSSGRFEYGLDRELGYFFGDGFDSEDIPEQVQDVRLVFWFDN